jgi:hypothetical protein
VGQVKLQLGGYHGWKADQQRKQGQRNRGYQCQPRKPLLVCPEKYHATDPDQQI